MAKLLRIVVFWIALGVAGATAGAWSGGCSSTPKKDGPTHRVEKNKPKGKTHKVPPKPRHMPHEHGHPHPHGESDHHHHAHPHPHVPGQNDHHHPY